jgi:phosphatidate cytidylyltransferase
VLARRVASAAVLVPALLAILLLGQPWLTLLVAAIAFLGAREAFGLLRSAGYAGEPLLGSVIAVVAVLGAWLLPDAIAVAGVAGTLALAGVAALAWPDPRDGFRVWAATAFGSLYIGLLGFTLRIVRDAPPLPPGAPAGQWLDGGRAWLLVLVLGVWAYDTGAYVAGRVFGRRKLIEHISPGKTWEGVVGGTAAAVGTCALTLTAAGDRGPLNLGPLVLGLLLAATAQAGDLAESMLKRAAGADESGALIPGHGGLLDRVDSFLFAAPAAYVYVLTVASAR